MKLVHRVNHGVSATAALLATTMSLIAPAAHVKRMQRACVLLLVSGLAQPALANELYQVELVVFANDGAYGSREVWPANIDLTLPQPLAILREGDGVDAAASADLNAYEKLPAQALTLRNEAAALARSRHRILLHAAWLQRIGGATSARNVYVEGGESFAPYRELGGTLRLTRQQFVHVDTNLWLTKFKRAAQTGVSTAPAQAPAIVNWPLPPLPPQYTDELGSGAAPDTALNDMLQKEYTVERIVLLQQHRRLKQHQLNYLDHPLMGVLIKVMPYSSAVAAPTPAPTTATVPQ